VHRKYRSEDTDVLVHDVRCNPNNNQVRAGRLVVQGVLGGWLFRVCWAAGCSGCAGRLVVQGVLGGWLFRVCWCSGCAGAPPPSELLYSAVGLVLQYAMNCAVARKMASFATFAPALNALCCLQPCEIHPCVV
jgi:hypothetical protein